MGIFGIADFESEIKMVKFNMVKEKYRMTWIRIKLDIPKIIRVLILKL